jgi:GT2 family glycosyltransferase
MVERVAPPKTVRRAGVDRMLQATRRWRTARADPRPPATIDDQYQTWLDLHQPDARRLDRLRFEAATRPWLPLVSIVMDARGPAEAVEATMASVLSQTYGAWELCIAGTAEEDAGVAMGRRLTIAIPNVRVLLHRQGAGVLDAAVKGCDGEFVLPLRGGLKLQAHAVDAFMRYVTDHPAADAVYADEDCELLSGRRCSPRFKPDWSPDLLLSCDYMREPLLIRRGTLDRAGGLGDPLQGAHSVWHHDLCLRVTELAREVGHVDDVLVTNADAPATGIAHTKETIDAPSGPATIKRALERRGLAARAETGAREGFSNVRYQITGSPRVVVIIPTRDHVDVLRACVDSIQERSTYANFAIAVVDNDSRDPETLKYLAASRNQVIRSPGSFNYSRIINDAVPQVSADHVILLNNDTTVIAGGWIEALLEHSQRSVVGAVGARLLYPDGRPQHEGIGLTPIGPSNLDSGMPAIRDVIAVTGACMMFRPSVFLEVGGFDEALAVSFGDVDFCMRLRQRGYWIIYTPLAVLCHLESASRGRLNPPGDLRTFCRRWGEIGKQHDPFLSRHVLRLNPLQINLQ